MRRESECSEPMSTDGRCCVWGSEGRGGEGRRQVYNTGKEAICRQARKGAAREILRVARTVPVNRHVSNAMCVYAIKEDRPTSVLS